MRFCRRRDHRVRRHERRPLHRLLPGGLQWLFVEAYKTANKPHPFRIKQFVFWHWWYIQQWMVENIICSAFQYYTYLQYACGGWLKNNPIPSGKSSWSTFKKLWQVEIQRKAVFQKSDKKSRTTKTPCEWCLSGQRRRRRRVVLLAQRLALTTMLVLIGWTFERDRKSKNIDSGLEWITLSL